MTIRNKLIFMAAAVLVVIAAMAAVTMYRGTSVVTDLVNDAGLEVVESAAQNIDARLDKIEAVAKSAAFSSPILKRKLSLGQANCSTRTSAV